MTDRHLKVEVWIVLGLSLGASGVYSLVSLIEKATRDGGIKQSTATLNANNDPREAFDFTYEVLGLVFALVIVALVLYLLTIDRDRRPVAERIGLDGRHRRFDAVSGFGLFALIGIPGLAFYFAGRAVGITAEIIPSPDLAYWWTGPMLVLAALKNALVEEVVVVGYLMTRLKQIGWSTGATIVSAAALRGSYHLYQGVGPGIGNFIMGLVFGYWFHRTKRVMPLVIAHTLLDVVAFVGYLLFADSLGLT
ncbi:MAG: family intrarane metalloprotease protein [Aeromicrobium sp.]|nr:family intrarane metalloprotease protein [Aeromicrobium sp.]